MMHQFEVKLWVNQFKFKKTCLEFVINNCLVQINSFKIRHITLKVEEIHRDCRCHEIKHYQRHIQTSRMERFAKIFNI